MKDCVLSVIQWHDMAFPWKAARTDAYEVFV